VCFDKLSMSGFSAKIHKLSGFLQGPLSLSLSKATR